MHYNDIISEKQFAELLRQYFYIQVIHPQLKFVNSQGLFIFLSAVELHISNLTSLCLCEFSSIPYKIYNRDQDICDIPDVKLKFKTAPAGLAREIQQIGSLCFPILNFFFLKKYHFTENPCLFVQLITKTTSKAGSYLMELNYQCIK